METYAAFAEAEVLAKRGHVSRVVKEDVLVFDQLSIVGLVGGDLAHLLVGVLDHHDGGLERFPHVIA